MHQLTRISGAITALGFSAVLLMGSSNADINVAIDSTTNDVTTDSAANNVITDSAANNVITDSAANNVITDSAANDVTTDSAANDVTTDSAANDVTTDSTTNDVTTDSAANDVTTDSAANDVTTDSAANTEAAANANSSVQNESAASPVTNIVSQNLVGNSRVAKALNKFLPTIKYTTENLSDAARKVNDSDWKTGTNIDRSIGTKLQALLNWQQNGVGSVDGYWGKNTRKAMQAFQKSRGLTVTETLNTETWQALTKNDKLMAQPVLVSYQLSESDINIKTTEIAVGAEAKAKLDGMYYESVIEGLAEKFHMSEKYLKLLNPQASFSVGETIMVYNSGNPTTKPVSRVVADSTTETLYTYDDKDNLIASYPTTVGSTATPSPTGTHKVTVKVYEPNYTYTDANGSKFILPPGPNNPVGLVWIGLSKPSYGIHGSPDPARISRQASAGCIRLTNWDALALLGTIQNGAIVEFI